MNPWLLEDQYVSLNTGYRLQRCCGFKAPMSVAMLS